MREKAAETLADAVRAALVASRGEWGTPHTIIRVRGKFRCVVFRDAEQECKRCRGKAIVTIFNPRARKPIVGRFDPRMYMIEGEE